MTAVFQTLKIVAVVPLQRPLTSLQLLYSADMFHFANWNETQKTTIFHMI